VTCMTRSSAASRYATAPIFTSHSITRTQGRPRPSWSGSACHPGKRRATSARSSPTNAELSGSVQAILLETAAPGSECTHLILRDHVALSRFRTRNLPRAGACEFAIDHPFGCTQAPRIHEENTHAETWTTDRCRW
jgi:hypothetical protein